MSNTRHVVVVRKDLNMPMGLMAAQVAHISDQFMREKLLEDKNEAGSPSFFTYEWDWFKDPYLSVLAVNCKEDLDIISKEAVENGLKVRSWGDLVPSPTFPDRMIKTVIGISIGPDDFDKIKIVTGKLPLL